MNNLIVRSLTGLVFISSIILPVLFNRDIATAVFSLYFVLGIIEFYRLFKSKERFDINWEVSSFVGTLVYGIAIASSLNWIPMWTLMFIPCVIFLLVLIELWRKTDKPINNMAINVFGIFYLVFPFTFITLLANAPSAQFPLILGMFILIWTNDSFAYLSGRFLGKHKMFERVSPKKTWEGTIGGALFTVVAAVLIAYLSDSDMMFWVVSAVIISPLAIVGDLLESLMKRDLQIKDSGTILPGHGGILDRFDATLFVAPFYFFWIFIYSFVL